MPQKPKDKRFIDMEGQVFGRWTVKKYNGKTKSTTFWICECSCGEVRSIQGAALRYGNTQSCGCLRDEVFSYDKIIHGEHGTPEYIAWINMKRRCGNNPGRDRKWYGKISICKRWEKVENFIADMGRRPSPNHSIDRIDGSKGYHPDNCRWATIYEQARNKKSNRIVSFRGKSQCLAAWSEECGIPAYTISRRLKAGWSIEKALTTPCAFRKKQLSGQSKCRLKV